MNLKSLVVSNQAIAEEAIASTLHGLISIVQETGDVLPLGPMDKLNEMKKILVFLLGKRAAATLGLSKNPGVSSEQIANALGMDVQRVREHLSRAKGKYFEKINNGYEIPIPRIPSVCAAIKE